MLQAIREKVVGWVIWVVLVLVGIPFAFWGVDSFFLGGGDPVVAKVGDQKIYQSQFRNAFENRYQQLQQMMGENFRPEMFDKKRFEKIVMDDLTQESMMRQYTHEAGYRANDAVLLDAIGAIPAFQKDGKFDAETYNQALKNVGRNVATFEKDLRNSIEQDQLRESVIETAFVTPAEAQAAYKLQNQERWLSYALFEASKYRDKVSLTDEQVKAKYETAKSQYMAPERIKLAYVELSADSLPKAVPPTDEVLKVLYDAEKDSRYTTTEERKARHILINLGTDKNLSQKKIVDLATKLKAGADFAQTAQANSDDSGSKAQGGDMGWIRKGQMVAEFEQALFGLKLGELSEPVETQFGWHLIKLDEIKPGSTKPFENAEVKAELIALFQTRESQKRFAEVQEKLETLAFENPASLDVPAKELGLTVLTTDWLTRAGGSGIGSAEEVKKAMFMPEIVKDNENSKPLPAGNGKVVVIRKAEYEAPRQRTLEEVSAELRATLVDELSRAQAAADAKSVLVAAQGGTALAEAVKAKGLELASPGLVKRDTAGTDRAILEALFKLKRPAAGVSSFGQASLANGNVAVVALTAVQEPEWNAEASDASTAKARLRDLRAGAEFNGYKQAIGKEIAVKLIEQPAEAEEPKPES